VRRREQQRKDIAIVLLLQNAGARNLKKVRNICSVTGASCHRDAEETEQYILFMCYIGQTGSNIVILSM
jgi:hypothetical protein